MSARAVFLATLLAVAPIVYDATAQAQAPPRPRTAPVALPFAVRVAPETVTVGERFRVTASVRLPPGSWVELDAPPTSERVMAVGKPETTLPDSAASVLRTVVEMVAWSPGPAEVLVATARVTDADGGTRMAPVALQLPVVRSVLPADTTKHRPRGAKDVFGPDRDWRLLALAAALALVALALALWWVVRRRKRRGRVVPGPRPGARQRALAELERARTSGHAEAGRWKAFYSMVSDALRGYAAAMDPAWSPDLTTSELVARMRRDGVSPERAAPLARALEAADLAKFARRPFTPETAHADLAAARAWVEQFGRDESPASSDVHPEAAGAGAGR
ncbi:MAG TPA: DUF4381 family protein [Longimicrobium sp.]|nr:DUF4381 family protein [Longimicrobium sp.]